MLYVEVSEHIDAAVQEGRRSPKPLFGQIGHLLRHTLGPLESGIEYMKR